MARPNYLTTGEAAKVFDLSRSTVTRMFDQGILSGKRHPITGKRLIAAECVEALIKKYDLPSATLPGTSKRVLLCSADDQLRALAARAVARDARLELHKVAFGGDALVGMARLRHDLLIIEDSLPDIPAAEVIHSVRRSAEHRDVCILCLTAADKAAQCHQAGADEALEKAGLGEERLLARILSLLELPREAPKPEGPFERQRRSPRAAVNLPAAIEIYPVKTPSQRIPGSATIANIGRGGAFLVDIQLETGHFPAEPFGLLVKVDQPPLADWQAHCRVIRLDGNESLAAGVVFVRISKHNLKKLSALVA